MLTNEGVFVMPELIVATTAVLSDLGDVNDVRMLSRWDISTPHDVSFTSPVSTFNADEHVSQMCSLRYATMRKINVVTIGNYGGNFHDVDSVSEYVFGKLDGVDVSMNTVTLNDLKLVDVTYSDEYSNITSSVDVLYGGTYRMTNSRAIESSSMLPWNKLNEVKVSTPLNYGYSLNDFLIGGSTNTDYLIDEDATIPPLPPFEPITGEVITIVNIINVVVLPSRTPIDFTDFTLARDIDSVAWVASFDIASKESLALIKPQGLNVKEVEIDINGEKFNIFIGRTSTGLTTDDTGKLVRRIKCTGWSNVKMLSFPYHSKRSHTETSPVTPSGILSAELTGTGFTGSWDSVDWTLPANVFSYFDKAPLAAIAELAESVGAVVKPDRTGKSFSVVPRYSVSPWNWATTTPDYQMGESQFFTIDTEWIPQEAPDSIYVYGEEHGAAVKCVKQGTAGLITLPTVVDKHITDTIAGTERGRIEVAKAGFKEIIPVTTYIDGNGIIELQKLIEVTDLDGGIWYGMVVGTSLSIKRNGNAIVQSLQIERHYD